MQTQKCTRGSACGRIFLNPADFPAVGFSLNLHPHLRVPSLPAGPALAMPANPCACAAYSGSPCACAPCSCSASICAPCACPCAPCMLLPMSTGRGQSGQASRHLQASAAHRCRLRGSSAAHGSNPPFLGFGEGTEERKGQTRETGTIWVGRGFYPC